MDMETQTRRVSLEKFFWTAVMAASVFAVLVLRLP